MHLPMKKRSKIPPKERNVIAGVGCKTASIALLFNQSIPYPVLVKGFMFK